MESGSFYLNDLMYGKEVMGTRLHISVYNGNVRFDILCIDTSDSYVVSKVSKDLVAAGFKDKGKQQPLRLKLLEDGSFETNIEPKRVVYYERQDVNKGGVWAKHHFGFVNSVVKRVAYIQSNFQNYKSKLFSALRSNGVCYNRGDVSDMEDDLCVSIRFIGGYGAWTAETEDLCDGGVLDKNVQKQVLSAIKDFNNGSDDVEVDVCSGEKCYSYFYFRSKSVYRWSREGSISDWVQEYRVK